MITSIGEKRLVHVVDRIESHLLRSSAPHLVLMDDDGRIMLIVDHDDQTAEADRGDIGRVTWTGGFDRFYWRFEIIQRAKGI